ncbi:hypothetical protein C6P45_004816 [Maudiozyma exigua]|uniref:ER membrane protein complex subunit 1 n=1 Tax=Maudiozyma exigua TaxID=34358 RepID=A0A9P6WA38_MAUEX|nr:hypothetical protein C6P45_004816 [Kazachstania exigua]
MLYTSLFTFLVCFWSSFVNAVYRDEAFKVDWQVSTIGEYRCVLKDYSAENQLIILSDFSESETLISYVNKTSGDVLLRYSVPYKITDAMIDSESQQLVLKLNDNLVSIDLNAGLPVTNETNGITHDSDFTFQSSCAVPDVKIDSKNGKQTLKIVDKTMGLPVFDIELPESFTEVKYLSTDHSQNLRFIVGNEDSQYVYFNYTNGGQNLTSTWEKDESLIDIVDSTFCDLKDSTIDAIRSEMVEEKEIDDIFNAYIYRVKKNFNRVKNYLQQNEYSPGRVFTSLLKENELMGTKNEELTYKRDLRFGLAKLLIVATRTGKVAALHISQGVKTMWSINTGIEDVVAIDYNSHKDQLVIIGNDGSFKVYNSINEHMPPSLIKDKKFNLSSNIEKISQIIDDVFFLSLSDKSKKIVSVNESVSSKANGYFVTDHDEKSINGYMVSSDNELVSTWSVDLNDEEKIVAFSARTEDPVVNVGNVLGNRTVLYKYLYPNLVSYAVVNEIDNTLYINLIDTITGELMYSQKHGQDEKVDINSPINLVFGENWFVYSYFASVPIPEQRLTVVELYESLVANEKKSNSSENYNPLKGNIKRPEAISKSYYFPQVIQDLKLTSTKFSITSKAIIIKLVNEQITFIPKFVLNARSKEESKMSDDDKKEFMASPYIAGIPINDNFIISHQRELIMGDDSKIVSTATNLESTSIVCEIGNDIFCSRIYPSGQFDVMSPSFEKIQLFGTIFIVMVIVYYLRPMVANKRLRSLWLIKD